LLGTLGAPSTSVTAKSSKVASTYATESEPDSATRHNSSSSSSRFHNSGTGLPRQQKSGGGEGSGSKLAERLVRGLRLKDLRSSEILEIYESKFRELASAQKQNEELLDAKTTALARADRLLGQHVKHTASDTMSNSSARGHVFIVPA
jgi:hypothetical protein